MEHKYLPWKPIQEKQHSMKIMPLDFLYYGDYIIDYEVVQAHYEVTRHCGHLQHSTICFHLSTFIISPQ